MLFLGRFVITALFELALSAEKGDRQDINKSFFG